MEHSSSNDPFYRDPVLPSNAEKKQFLAPEDGSAFSFSQQRSSLKSNIFSQTTEDEDDLGATMGSTRPSIASIKIKVFKKRYVMLALFTLLNASAIFPWLQFSIIANLVVRYYGVSFQTVNWTSMIYMVAYLILIFPAIGYLKRFGIRGSLLLAASLNCAGSWIKVSAVDPSRFYAAMIGQSFSAVAQVFIIGLPAQVSAVWFGTNEVSYACGIGASGAQLGVALGFLIPPQAVPSTDDINRIGEGLGKLFFCAAAINSVIFLLILVVFEENPPMPPSHAQAFIDPMSSVSYLLSIKRISRNFSFLLLFLTYGMNVGTIYAFSTLLNQELIPLFKDREAGLGLMGLAFILSGLVGAIAFGICLDRTKLFKESFFVVYLLTFVFILVYIASLTIHVFWITFSLTTILGMFMAGFIPIGFEFAAEMTYPEPEGTSSGLLNASAQVFGLITTAGASYILDHGGIYYSYLAMAVVVGIGAFLSGFIKPSLKRSYPTFEDISEYALDDRPLRPTLDEDL